MPIAFFNVGYVRSVGVLSRHELGNDIEEQHLRK